MANISPFPKRLEGESNEWYSRFCAWLVMGRPRSVLAVANAEREARGRKRADEVPGSWDGKNTAFKWDERAAIWDEAESLRLAKSLAKRREDWRKTEIRIAKKMMKKAEDGLGIPLRGSDTSVDETKEDGTTRRTTTRTVANPQAVRVAALLAVEGSKLGRTALEIPDAARLGLLIAKYNIPYNAFTNAQRERIMNGDDPIEVALEAWAADRAQKPKPLQD